MFVDEKQVVREKVWALLEKKGASRFPGPKGRIPNFVGSESCARWLEQIEEWQQASTIKSNPDSPQRQIRYQALKEGKTVYMAVPRLADAKPFIELNPNKLKSKLYEASSIKGAFQYGRPVALQNMKTIDLVVCGSVAVNRKGVRIGKGEGYSELEFAIAVEAGILKRDVPILTSVHPLQIIRQSISRKHHDFAVDIILTPDRILRCQTDRKRPTGIYWDDLSEGKRKSIPILERIFQDRYRVR